MRLICADELVINPARIEPCDDADLAETRRGVRLP